MNFPFKYILFFLIILGSIDKENSDIKAAITYIKHQSRDSWPQLLQKWSVTHAFRRKILLETRSNAQLKATKIKKKDSESEHSDDEEEQLINEYIKKWDVYVP